MPSFSQALPRLKHLPLVALLLGLLSSTGCSSGGKTVSGKATVDGVSLKSGTVRFVPDKTKGNTAGQEAIGTIGEDGTYTMYINNKSQVPLGWYKVAVDASEKADSSKPFAAGSLINKKYNDPEKSGLSIEVVASPPAGAYDLKLTK